MPECGPRVAIMYQARTQHAESPQWGTLNTIALIWQGDQNLNSIPPTAP